MKTTTIDNFKALELCKILGNFWAVYEPKVIPYLVLLEPHAYAPSDHLSEYKKHKADNKIDIQAIINGDQKYIRNARRYDVINRVAIMEFEGPVVKRSTSFGYMFGEYALQTAGNMTLMAHADEDVDRIIHDVESPGGVVGGIPDYIEIIKAVDSEKPVFTYANGLLASASYWPAVSTRYIGMGKDADVGCIGVFTYLYDQSKFAKDLGIKAYRFRYPDGKNSVKGLGVPGIKISEADKKYIQQGVDTYGKDFVNTVAKFRNLSRRDIFNMGGRAFIGEEAVKMGLADGVFTRNEFIEAVASGELDNTNRSKKSVFNRGKKNTAAFKAGPEDDEEDDDDNLEQANETEETEEGKENPSEETTEQTEEKELVAFLRGRKINSVAQLESVFEAAESAGEYRKNAVDDCVKQAIRFFGQDSENFNEADFRKTLKGQSVKILNSMANQYKSAADKLHGVDDNEAQGRKTASSDQHAYATDAVTEKYQDEAKEIVNRRFGRKAKTANGR